MAQQQILKLIEMPDHTPENPSLNESHIARHNLIDAKGLSPTEEELKAEETRLLEEYASLKYQRERKYPRMNEQLDLLYWDKKNGTKKWEEAIDKVKEDNPKPKESK